MKHNIILHNATTIRERKIIYYYLCLNECMRLKLLSLQLVAGFWLSTIHHCSWIIFPKKKRKKKRWETNQRDRLADEKCMKNMKTKPNEKQTKKSMSNEQQKRQTLDANKMHSFSSQNSCKSKKKTMDIKPWILNGGSWKCCAFK